MAPAIPRERLRAIGLRYGAPALLLLTFALFVLVDKAAYQSYFSDDDFSNLSVSRFIPWPSLIEALFSLTYVSNVRPFGLVYYKALGDTAHFWFPPYLAVLQVIHVATAGLLWLFLKRLGVRPFAAALGCLFFALNAATLTAYWKPMYVFDVLCGLWVILCLLFYQRGRVLLSLFCAFFAFKSKEIEILLPIVLFGFEWWFGRTRSGRWLALVPFFLLSLSFGVQSMLQSATPGTAYAPAFTLQAIGSGLAYYSGKLLYAPFSGLTISIGLLFIPSRLIRFGVLGFWILLAPMLLFPFRESGAYLYVPLLLFTVAVAAVADRKPLWFAIFLLIWLPATYEQTRVERNPIIAFGHEHRPYVAQVLDFLKSHPSVSAVVWDGTPKDFAVWGQEGLFTYGLDKWNLPVVHVSHADALKTIRMPGAVLFTWDAPAHRLIVNSFAGDGYAASWVDFAHENPFWLMKSGWKGMAAGCRLIGPKALIALRDPPANTAFTLRAQAQPGQTVYMSAAGQLIGQHRFETSAAETVSWPVPSSREAVLDFEIRVDPPDSHSPPDDPLGIAVCACGFKP